MTRYVLDTNTVSLLMRNDEAVVARLRDSSRHAVRVPQPVVAELEYGVRRLRKSRRRTRLEGQLALVLAELGRAVWTDEVSARFGEIKATLERRGAPLEDMDIAIAAQALANGAVLVTSNTRHLGRVPGLECEDWAASGNHT